MGKNKIFKIFIISFFIILSIIFYNKNKQNSSSYNYINFNNYMETKKYNDILAENNNNNIIENDTYENADIDNEIIIVPNENEHNMQNIIVENDTNNNEKPNNKNSMPEKFSQIFNNENIDNSENFKNINIDNNSNETINSNNSKPQKNDDLESYWKDIDEIVSFADNYYKDNYSKTRLITKNGRLYNKAAERYVDINFLVEKGLNEIYKNYSCDILLINPNDLKEFNGLSIKSSENGLTVFIAVKHNTKNEYILSSANSAGGVISSDEYNKFIYKYYQKYGNPVNILPNTEKYQTILGFIKLYEGIYSDYFVRNIVADNKYASVILSPISNMNDIRQYILVNENNFWKVVLSGLENVSRLPIYVNEQLPDFNIDMLPKYEISNFNVDNFEYNNIYYTLINNNYISDPSDIYYISGADRYCYVKDYTGKYYLLIKQNGIWNINKPSGYNEAYDIMIKSNPSAPTFILLYE